MIPKYRVYDLENCEMWVANDYDDLSELFMALDTDNSMFSNPMQSTGLYDKNGVEIFDGDIVNFMVPNQMISGTYQIRQAKSGEWRLDNRAQGRPLYISGSYHCEVIGNVWEDGDLLEKVEE